MLRQTIDTELPHLRALPEAAASLRPAGPESWSPKQELGHLIDSAANNHIRFVCAATQPSFQGPTYAQDAWVSLHAYSDQPWHEIIDFWYAYNSFLANLITRIPADALEHPCAVGTSQNPVPLRFLIEDYELHMQHHIDHLLSRPVVTPYPRV